MKPTITSRKNPVVRHLRLLLRQARSRRKEGLWVLEGVRLVGEALDGDLTPVLSMVSPRLLEAPEGEALLGRLIEHARQARVPPPMEATDEALGWASAVEVSQGVLIAVPAPAVTVPLTGGGLVAAAAGVQDPGNLGALARVVEGVGALGLLLLDNCVDPGNPKALRASAGSLLRVPHQRMAGTEALERLREAGYRVAAADASGGIAYTEHDWRGSWALVLGSEGAGIPGAVQDGADVTVHVPVRRIESLNAAVAGAVLLFEAARQRA